MGRMIPRNSMRLIEVEGSDKLLPVWPYYFNLPLIYYYMHKNNYTIESFAKKLKVSVEELNNLLEYRSYCFPRDIFERLSKVMECPIEYILLDDFLSFGGWDKF